MAGVLHPIEGRPRGGRVIVPLIVEALQPASVIDLGCNNGGWLAEFADHGVADVIGVDAPYVLDAELLIPRDRFVAFDLESDARLDLDRRFDVALCLECAEHLDEAAGARLIRTLSSLADHVVFSAAVPGQTGVGHKNEQYPAYWSARFEQLGYKTLDLFRPRIWNDDSVEFWYRQNMFLFTRQPEKVSIAAPEWDGSVLIRPELLEIYVRELGARNTNAIVTNEYLCRTARQRGFDIRPARTSVAERVRLRLQRMLGAGAGAK